MDELVKKISKFVYDPKIENLLTLEEYNKLTPYYKGMSEYLQSNWEESKIPNNIIPYKKGTQEYEEFKSGIFQAMMIVQEMNDD